LGFYYFYDVMSRQDLHTIVGKCFRLFLMCYNLLVRFKLGANQKKILLLLAGGVSLGCARSSHQYFNILKACAKEWRKINTQELNRAISSLYKSKLLEEKENSDGSVTMVLSTSGKRVAMTFNLDEMKIKTPLRWDHKWRIVLFDVPEKYREGRDSLRTHLKNLGFFEYQKSVFVHPYECSGEIDFIIETYDLRRFVRFVLADFLDNELHLKAHFSLA